MLLLLLLSLLTLSSRLVVGASAVSSHDGLLTEGLLVSLDLRSCTLGRSSSSNSSEVEHQVDSVGLVVGLAPVVVLGHSAVVVVVRSD